MNSFGWYLFQLAGRPTVGEAGVNLGFIANGGFFPGDKLGVALGNLLTTAEDTTYTREMVGRVFDVLGVFD
jgi:hypothetical protein